MTSDCATTPARRRVARYFIRVKSRWVRADGSRWFYPDEIVSARWPAAPRLVPNGAQRKPPSGQPDRPIGFAVVGQGRERWSAAPSARDARSQPDEKTLHKSDLLVNTCIECRTRHRLFRGAPIDRKQSYAGRPAPTNGSPAPLVSQLSAGSSDRGAGRAPGLRSQRVPKMASQRLELPNPSLKLTTKRR